MLEHCKIYNENDDPDRQNTRMDKTTQIVVKTARAHAWTGKMLSEAGDGIVRKKRGGSSPARVGSGGGGGGGGKCVVQ